MRFIIEHILQILLVIALSSFFVIFFIKKNKNHASNKQITESELQIKFRAYERLMIFLERVEPVGMLNRLSLHEMQIHDIKSILVKRIITEYEYNVSQQIYVSSALWKLIESAKNLTINNIVTASDSLSSNSTVDQFVDQILKSSQSNAVIFQKAKEMLKQEVLSLS